MTDKNDQNRVVLLMTILERGSGKSMKRFLDRHKISCHLEFHGNGTATSEMRDLLGYSRDKDVILSLGTQKAMASLISSMDSGLWEISRGHGLMMQLSPSAINNLISAILIHSASEIPDSENKEGRMENEFNHSLILIAVKQGYTEQVMQTARKAGAAGGTVIRSRMMGTEQFEQNFGIHIDEEKEIIAILAPDTIRNEILESVNSEFGLRSPAQSIVCALPVDRAYKI